MSSREFICVSCEGRACWVEVEEGPNAATELAAPRRCPFEAGSPCWEEIDD